jgi:acylphosphatase
MLRSRSDVTDDVRAQLKITGRVQGVTFRASAAAEARRLGLSGWVRNLPDGGVEAVVEGPAERVGEFVLWCGDGPPGARVEDVCVQREAASGEFDAFRVRH